MKRSLVCHQQGGASREGETQSIARGQEGGMGLAGAGGSKASEPAQGRAQFAA